MADTTFVNGVGTIDASWLNDVNDVVYDIYPAERYGALPSASGSTNTAAIQAAINAANSAGGGVVTIGSGTYLLAAAGTHGPEVRNYGLLLKSNVRLQGMSMASTILKADTNEDMDIIITSRTSSSSNISLVDLTIDGNQANQTGNTFNHWLYDIDGLVIHKVLSKDSCNWGFRLERCTNVIGAVIRADHAADINADGFHMQDCNTCTLDNILIDTKGDDGFIITANNMDTYDITVSGLVVTCPVTVAAAGRGILFNLGNGAESASQQRNFKNITINATTYNCKGSAAVLTYGEFENITLNLTDYGSGSGLYLVCGSANVTGYIKGCRFDIVSVTPDQNCMTTVITDGVVENNHLDLIGYDPGDGYVGVDLEGSYWTGSINIDYDPAGSKVSGLQCLDMIADYSDLHVTLDGGGTSTYGIKIRAGALHNTFRIGRIQNMATAAIDVNTVNDNTFIGGSMDANAINFGSNIKFIGVTGGHAYGTSAAIATGGTIAHGLTRTPAYFNVMANSAKTGVYATANATNIQVNFTGGGTSTFTWEAKI